MRLKVIKPLKRYDKGNEIPSMADTVEISVDQAVEYGLIEKVEDRKKPKFRIGDEVVIGDAFHVINRIQDFGTYFLYNGFLETAIRFANAEEIELYFRN